MISSGQLKYHLKIWVIYIDFHSKVGKIGRTQKGGYTGNKDISNSSKVVPIAKWMQRKLMWKSGYNKLF